MKHITENYTQVVCFWPMICPEDLIYTENVLKLLKEFF